MHYKKNWYCCCRNFLFQLRLWFWLGFVQYPTILAIFFSFMTCWKIDLHLYWVLCLTILMADSQSDWDARDYQIKKSFWPTRLWPGSVLQNEFISLWTLHESCRPVRVNEFRILNILISISEAQDILMWISNEKAENSAARRILTRVLR